MLVDMLRQILISRLRLKPLDCRLECGPLTTSLSKKVIFCQRSIR